ncbi:cytochrome P450, partial [Trifolium medium]|nr:cytochrome P450 [Trifolium medium]
MQVCDAALCFALWGSSSYDFSYRKSVGASEGLLTIWDSSEVEVWSSTSREHFYLAKVYAPCD